MTRETGPFWDDSEEGDYDPVFDAKVRAYCRLTAADACQPKTCPACEGPLNRDRSCDLGCDPADTRLTEVRSDPLLRRVA